MNCVFCDIAAGRRQAAIVYEDEQVVAFHDINPQAPVHVLVIPREHIPGPLAIAAPHEALAGHMLVVAGQVAQDLGIATDGYRLVLNQGTLGGQSVFHLHLHLLGGRRMRWPPG